MRIQPIILLGGIGRRLWPLSRPHKPKQFLPLIDKKSLFQVTLLRIADKRLFLPPLIIANQTYETLVKTQAHEAGIKSMTLLLEPTARNTAAPIVLAALLGKPANSVQLILPSDHYIGDHKAFIEAVQLGATCAHQKKIITFGISPDRPATQYGYMQLGQESDIKGAFDMPAFCEKPNRAGAKKWLARGRCQWNSGMFMFAPDTLLAQMQTHCPILLAACKQAIEATTWDTDIGEIGTEKSAKKNNDIRLLRFAPAHFAPIPSLPFDIAVMEKTDCGIVIPTNMEWCDIGSWSQLYHMYKMRKAKARQPVRKRLATRLRPLSFFRAMIIDFMRKTLY